MSEGIGKTGSAQSARSRGCIIAPSRPHWHEPAVWGGPAVIVAFCGILLGVGVPASHWLAYQRVAIEHGQWWRLLSGNFVHLGTWHFAFNALSLGLWLFLYPSRLTAIDWGLRLLVLGLGVGLGLYFFVPDVGTYVGLSGIIYGLFLLDLGREALVEADRFALLCVIFVIVRVGWEAINGAPAYESHLLGGPVVTASHFCGMAAAVLYGAAGLWRQWRVSRTTGASFRILGRER